VVVVSAFYGVTNALVASVDSEKEPPTRDLRNLHHTILAENIPAGPLRDRVAQVVSGRIDPLEGYLIGIHCIGEAPPFVHDAVLSHGERLSSLILAEVLSSRGLRARERFPEDQGPVTDGVFGNRVPPIR